MALCNGDKIAKFYFMTLEGNKMTVMNNMKVEIPEELITVSVQNLQKRDKHFE